MDEINNNNSFSDYIADNKSGSSFTVINTTGGSVAISIVASRPIETTEDQTVTPGIRTESGATTADLSDRKITLTGNANASDEWTFTIDDKSVTVDATGALTGTAAALADAINADNSALKADFFATWSGVAIMVTRRNGGEEFTPSISVVRDSSLADPILSGTPKVTWDTSEDSKIFNVETPIFADLVSSKPGPTTWTVTLEGGSSVAVADVIDDLPATAQKIMDEINNNNSFSDYIADNKSGSSFTVTNKTGDPVAIAISVSREVTQEGSAPSTADLSSKKITLTGNANASDEWTFTIDNKFVTVEATGALSGTAEALADAINADNSALKADFFATWSGVAIMVTRRNGGEEFTPSISVVRDSSLADPILSGTPKVTWKQYVVFNPSATTGDSEDVWRLDIDGDTQRVVAGRGTGTVEATRTEVANRFKTDHAGSLPSNVVVRDFGLYVDGGLKTVTALEVYRENGTPFAIGNATQTRAFAYIHATSTNLPPAGDLQVATDPDANPTKFYSAATIDLRTQRYERSATITIQLDDAPGTQRTPLVFAPGSGSGGPVDGGTGHDVAEELAAALGATLDHNNRALSERYDVVASGGKVTITEQKPGLDPFQLRVESGASFVDGLFDIDKAEIMTTSTAVERDIYNYVPVNYTCNTNGYLGYYNNYTCTTYQGNYTKVRFGTLTEVVRPTLSLYAVDDGVETFVASDTFGDTGRSVFTGGSDAGSATNEDPFLQHRFNSGDAGTYRIKVSSYKTYTFEPNNDPNPFSTTLLVSDSFRVSSRRCGFLNLFTCRYPSGVNNNRVITNVGYDNYIRARDGFTAPIAQPVDGVVVGQNYELIISLPGHEANKSQIDLVGKVVTFIDGDGKGEAGVIAGYNAEYQTYILEGSISDNVKAEDTFEITTDPYTDGTTQDTFGDNSPLTDSYDVVLTGAPDSLVTVNVSPRPTRTFDSDLVFDARAGFGQKEEVQVAVATTKATIEIDGVVEASQIWTVVLRPVDSDGRPVVTPEIVSITGATSAASAAQTLGAEVNLRTATTGVSATVAGSIISLTGVPVTATGLTGKFFVSTDISVSTAFTQGRGTITIDRCDSGELEDRRCENGVIEPPFKTLPITDRLAIEFGGFTQVGEIWTLKLGPAAADTYTYTARFREGPDVAAAAIAAAIAASGSYDVLVTGRVLTIARKDGVRIADVTASVNSNVDPSTTATVQSFLEFVADGGADNAWNKRQTVWVMAVDDDFIDGGDALVFPAFEERVNAIRGPLTIQGGIPEGSEQQINDPFGLPTETNLLRPEGFISDSDFGVGATTVDLGALNAGDGVLVDPLADHVNATTGERPGFDPRMDDFSYVVTFIDPVTFQETELDVNPDGVSADILSLVDVENSFDVTSFTAGDGELTFQGTPDQGDLSDTIEWTQATLELTASKVHGFTDDPTITDDNDEFGEEWKLVIGTTTYTSGRLSADDASLVGAAKLLVADINERSNYTANIAIGLLGNVRIVIQSTTPFTLGNSGAGINVVAGHDRNGDSVTTDGAVIVSGTPVTSTAAGVKWNKAGFFFSGDYTGAWQIVVGGKTYDVNGATNNIRSIEDLTNEFARQIRGNQGNLAPVVSGTTVTFTSAWPGGDVPAAGIDYSITPLNPNERVLEADQVDTLNIFHKNSPADDVGYLTEDRLTGLGLGGDAVIAGLRLDGGVTYFDVEELDIELGQGNNRFTIDSTHEGATIITSGAGYDTFNVRSIGGHTEINTGANNDTVNVGTGVNFAADINDGVDVVKAPDFAHYADSISAILTINGGSDRIVGSVLGPDSGTGAGPVNGYDADTKTITDTNAQNPVDIGNAVDRRRTTVDVRTQTDIGTLIVDVAIANADTAPFADPTGNVTFIANDNFDDFDVFVFNYRLCDIDGVCARYVVSIDTDDLVNREWSGNLYSDDKSLKVNRTKYVVDLSGSTITITGGTGAGQQALIVGNTATTFEIDQAFGVALDNTSTYEISSIGRLGDIVTIDDSGDDNDNKLTVTQNTVSGIDMPSVPEIQTILVQANKGDYELTGIDIDGIERTRRFEYGLDAEGFEERLRYLFGIEGIDVTAERTSTDVRYTVTFLRSQAGYNWEQIVWNEAGSNLTPNPDNSAFVKIDTERQGRTAPIAEIQTITVTGVGGEFVLGVDGYGRGEVPSADDDLNAIVRRARSAEITFDFPVAVVDPDNPPTAAEAAVILDAATAQMAAALNQLVGFTGITVTATRANVGDPTENIIYTVTFGGAETGQNPPALRWLESEDNTKLVTAEGEEAPNARVDTVTDMRGKKLNNQQTLTIDATGGTFTLAFDINGDGIITPDEITDEIAHDVKADSRTCPRGDTTCFSARCQTVALSCYLETILNPNNSNAALPFTNNFRVSKHDNVFHITFQGDHRHLVLEAANVTDNLDGTIHLDQDRLAGVSYYGIETLNLVLGDGDDVANIQGTSATTNLYLRNGNDRIYVSDDADVSVELSEAPTFLTGTLDDIDGLLNIRGGAGNQTLMISDEASPDDNPDVLITDKTDAALLTDPTVPAAAGELVFGPTQPGGLPAVAYPNTDTEIYIVGLSDGSITFSSNKASNEPGVDDDGSYIGGITIWTGFGDDIIKIDGTHRTDGVDFRGLQTITTLNTGLGDDVVTVTLTEPIDANADGVIQITEALETDDGFFVLNTQGPFNHELILAPDTIFEGGYDTPADTVTVTVNGVVLDPSIVFVNYGGPGENDRVLITDSSAIRDGDEVVVIVTPPGPQVITAPSDDIITVLPAGTFTNFDAVTVTIGGEELDTAEFTVDVENDQVIIPDSLISQGDAVVISVDANDVITDFPFVGGSDALDLALEPGSVDAVSVVTVITNGMVLDPALFTVDTGTGVITVVDDALISESDDVIVLVSNAPTTFTGPQAVDPDIDTVNAAGSTLPLIIFGGQGSDTIKGGSSENIIFGDRGRVLVHSIPPGEVDDALIADLAQEVRDQFTDTELATIEELALAELTEAELAALSSIKRADLIDAAIDAAALPAAQAAFDALTADELEALTYAKLAEFEDRAETVLGHGGPGDRTSTFAIDPTYAYSIDPRIGDGDTIISQGADDIIVGGRGHCDTHDSALPCVDVVDDINAGGGNNIVLGDSGRLGFADGLITSAVSLAPAVGGPDTISSTGGVDIVIGGDGGDTVQTGDGNDIVLGDNGFALFDHRTVAGVDTSVLREIASTDTDIGGIDEIIVGQGDDVVIAGGGGDRVNYTLDAGEFVATDTGDDVVIGDNGNAEFDTTTGESVIDFIETIAPEHGGDDLIFVGEGADVVLGGSGSDVIDAGLGNYEDVVLGDNGIADFDVLIPEGGTDKVSVLSEVTSTAVGTGGDDTIITGDGADYVIAGVGDDKVNVGVTAPDFGDDVVIGDNGHVDFDTTTGESVIDFIETIAPEHGGDDLIFVGEGADVVLGGSGADTIDAGLGNYEDVVLGDNGDC